MISLAVHNVFLAGWYARHGVAVSKVFDSRCLSNMSLIRPNCRLFESTILNMNLELTDELFSLSFCSTLSNNYKRWTITPITRMFTALCSSLCLIR